MLATLNPEAGAVPMPHTGEELRVAERAGRVSYRAHPYYAWRYRDRGRAFTASDSAWLVHLSNQTSAEVGRQVRWLHSILTNRGMPGLLLERHLIVLGRGLERSLASPAPRGRKLIRSATGLRARRLRQIDAESTASLARAFAEKLGAPRSRLLVGTGEIIVSAVADALSGAPNSVPSLIAWLGDVQRLASTPELVQSLDARSRQALSDMGVERPWRAAIDATLRSCGWRAPA